MAVIAITSAKGSPGVTTNALALTLTWPRDVLLVEADPAGGDIMAGYVRAELRGDRGLGYLAVAARHDRIAEEMAGQVIDLSQRRGSTSRLLLPGISEPAEAAGVAPAWPALAMFFVRLGAPATPMPRDVIVDCGRMAVAYPPIAMLAAADLVLLVVRTSLRSAASAAAAVTLLRRELTSAGGDPDRVALVVVESGEYRPADLSRSLGAPVVASMPWREREAAALSDGIGRAPESSPLMRSARTAAEAMVRRLARTQPSDPNAQMESWSHHAPSGGMPPGPPSGGRPASGLPSAGRPPADRVPGDRIPGDRALGDRALGDRALGDRALRDRALRDRALGDRALGDRAHTAMGLPLGVAER